MRFELQGAAFNITSAAFGRVTSQANTPRAVQFSARLRFYSDIAQGCGIRTAIGRTVILLPALRSFTRAIRSCRGG